MISLATGPLDFICTCFGHLCFFLLIFILIIPVVLWTIKRERWHKDNTLPHLLWCAAGGVYRFTGRPPGQHTRSHQVPSSSSTYCSNKYRDPCKDHLETTTWLQHQMGVSSVHVLIVSKSIDYVPTTFVIACNGTSSQLHSSIWAFPP